MLGPGSGGIALFATTGSGPIVRSGSGAGAQGGPEGLAAVLGALTGFGAGVMTGRYGGLEECAISPRLPPCQVPAAGQPSAVAGSTGARLGRAAAPSSVSPALTRPGSAATWPLPAATRPLPAAT
jgi:hypothetical protein